MPALFEISDDMMALSMLLDETGGELTPESEQAFEEWFRENEANAAEKMDGYIAVVRRAQMHAAAAKEEAERFLKASQIETNKASRLLDRMKLWLEMTGRAKPGTPKTETTKAVPGVKFTTAAGRTLALVNNGGLKPLEIDPGIFDPESPDADPRFVKVKKELDRDALRKALDAGEKIAWARLNPRSVRLEIK